MLGSMIVAVAVAVGAIGVVYGPRYFLTATVAACILGFMALAGQKPMLAVHTCGHMTVAYADAPQHTCTFEKLKGLTSPFFVFCEGLYITGEEGVDPGGAHSVLPRPDFEIFGGGVCFLHVRNFRWKWRRR
jgi:hypothetical protein